MTKGEALQQFFSGFGIPAYPASAVPDDVVFPWLTYEMMTGAFGDADVTMTVNLWYYTESEALPNAKAEEISQSLGLGGTLLECDEGLIWLKRGEPWCQNVPYESSGTSSTSNEIKRRYLNVDAEYITR